MKTIFAKFVVPAALLGAIAAAPLAAQADTPYHHHNVNARLHEQHARIEQGVHSGQLTHWEAARLKSRDARIRRQEHYLHRTGGHLSASERARLEREENRTSHAIYRQKHDHQIR